MVAHIYETIAHFLAVPPNCCNFAAHLIFNNVLHMTKAEIEKKRSLARTLFMSGMEQAEIAENRSLACHHFQVVCG